MAPVLGIHPRKTREFLIPLASPIVRRKKETMNAAHVLDGRVLVLNRGWQAIRVSSVKEAIGLVAKGSARIIDPKDFAQLDLMTWADVSKARAKFGDAVIRSQRLVLLPPEVVVLTGYEGIGERSVVFSRRNLFKRDKYTCLVPGTLIQMADGGWKPIDEVASGERIVTARGTSVVTNRMVRVATRPCVAVKPYYGLPVVATDDHRFLVEREGTLAFAPAADLVGERLAWPIHEGDAVIKPLLAELIGYYAAEGDRTGAHGVEYHTRFTVAPEEDKIVDGIKRCVQEMFGKDKHVYDQMQTDPRTGSVYRVIRVSSLELAQTLSKYVQGKAKNKRFMFDPMSLDTNTAMTLLEAVIAGDGCDLMVRDSKSRVITTASPVLALQLQRLVWRTGKSASIVSGRQNEGGYKPGAVAYFIRWFPETERHLGRIVVVDGAKYMSVPVQYVKKADYTGPVWDLEVFAEEDVGHSFVTPAGTVHNCMYCGVQPGPDELTVDHVLPKSKGGKSTWENCVLACVECNKRKDNRTPEQAGMKLRRQPRKPSWKTLIHVSPRERRESWNQFLSKAYWEVELEP